jgi:hypothetical protein
MKKLLVAIAASLLTAVSSGQAFAQSAILGATDRGTNTGDVLGATSTLTNTGQNIILSVIVGSVLLFAVVLIVLNNKRKNSLSK